MGTSIRARGALLLIIVALALAGCRSVTPVRPLRSPSSTALPATIAAAEAPGNAVATATPMVVPDTLTPEVATPTAAAVATPSAVPTPTPAIAASPTAGVASDAVNQAIKDVITRGNQEQELAFSKHDPTLMRDTSTADYYQEVVQINQDLADSGVTAIKLLKLEWGPISLPAPGRAEATTFETWRTTFDDGTTEDSRDRNVYALIQDGGAWKIMSDQHPDSIGDQTSPPAPGTPQPSPRVTPVIVPAGPGQSHNWSGYDATGGTFTGVTGTWTIPQPSTSQRFAAGATWVGIGGVRTHDLIQAGTEETVLGSGQVRYAAWIELLPATSRPVPLTVSPGDSVTVTITQQSPGAWLVHLKNDTTGQDYQTTKHYDSSLSSAEWVEEAPSGRRQVLPLEDFGTVQFTAASATKNGKQVTIAEAGGKAITMIDRGGQVLTTPSKLGADGSSFSVMRS